MLKDEKDARGYSECLTINHNLSGKRSHSVLFLVQMH